MEDLLYSEFIKFLIFSFTPSIIIVAVFLKKSQLRLFLDPNTLYIYIDYTCLSVCIIALYI